MCGKSDRKYIFALHLNYQTSNFRMSGEILGKKIKPMKYLRELKNGFIIFAGIGIYFIILELLGLSDLPWLRIFNVVFVVFGVNQTIKGNQAAGVRGYMRNLFAAIITSVIGAILSVGSLLGYIEYRGGEEYLKKLSENFIFGGGDITIQQYCIGLFFEAMAASIITSFCLMQYWKGKVEVIDKVGKIN